MSNSQRTQLVLLASGLLILAVVSAEWWTSSPQRVRRVGEAILIIAAATSALGNARPIPSATPAVLYTTVIGGAVVIARPGGRLFPIILSVFVALAWVSVVFVQKMWTKNLGQRTDSGPRTDLVPSTTNQGLP